jgi:hypothetical protein
MHLQVAEIPDKLESVEFISKIQRAKYIEDMYSNEYLYFSWLKDFRRTDEDKSGQNDPRELNTKTEQLKIMTLNVGGKDFPLHNLLKDFKGQFNEHYVDARLNCCSLHWMEIEPEEAPKTYDDKLLNLGNRMLLIYDWQRFFEVLDKSIKEMGLEFSRKRVTYYDPETYNGELTLHHKDKKFEYQNEYRILIAPTNKKSMNIPIPGLKDISAIVDTTDYLNLRTMIEIQQNE